MFGKYNLLLNPVEKLPFDNIFSENDIAQCMTFKSIITGIFHDFTMDVDAVYKCIENFCGGLRWYMMESKDFITHIKFNFYMQIE